MYWTFDILLICVKIKLIIVEAIDTFHKNNRFERNKVMCIAHIQHFYMPSRTIYFTKQ